MLVDGIKLFDTSVAENLAIASGTTFPSNADIGELFYKLTEGLFVFDGTTWQSTSNSGTGSSSIGDGLVQVSDGSGGFQAISAPTAASLVLTSNAIGLPTWEPAQVSGGTVKRIDISGGTTGLTASGGPITNEGDFILGGTLSVAHGGTGASSVSGAIANLLPTQTGHTGAALMTDGAGNLHWEVPPGTSYTAGTGLTLTGTTFSSTVAPNNGVASRVTVTVGDGTVTALAAGASGTVLTSNGEGQPPAWRNISGTVSEIVIDNTGSAGLYIAGGDYVSSGISKITTTGSIALNGVLSVDHGGTGGTTKADAIVNLLPTLATGKFLTNNGTYVTWGSPFPDTTGNSGKFLTTDGTSVSWGSPSGVGTVTSVQVSGGSTGLTFSGGPITGSGTLTAAGTLAIANGGTGGTTKNEALNNLLPDQTSNSGKVLTTNGSSTSWTTASAGTVTSVEFNTGTTGLTVSGGPITSSGTITLDGVLSIANGGTGGTTSTTAITNLLPSQSGNVGKVLATNGTSVYWTTPATGGGSGTVTSVQVDGGSTGLSFSGGPITSSGSISMGGTLAITNGGTGGATKTAALTNLLPDQANNSGKVLSTNGTTASWTTVAAGTVTSVQVDGGSTGLTFSGGPITSTGTMTLAGTLAIANGGTGAASAQTARNNLLPAQSSYTGCVLATNGTDVYWSNASTMVSAAGTSMQVQYNKNGAFTGSSSLLFDDSTGLLTATSFSGSGAALTSLNGSSISTGTVPVARLGSGTPSSSTYLRGDGTWTTHYDAKYDLALSITSKPLAGAYVLNFVVVNPFSLPAGLTGSVAKAGTAATASTTFTIYKNSTSVGTIVWAAAGTTASFTFSSAQSFVSGDLIQIAAPSTADSTLANIAITLKGTLTA